MNDVKTILERLSQPLEMTRVKRRQAPGEGTIPFLEGYDVIQTANDIFGYSWSFDLLSEPKVMVWEQALTTWDRQRRERIPVIDPESGKPRTQRAGMVYLTGKVTIELDDKLYTHADVGRLSFIGETPEALDTALSGAATDCLKRCFRQMGSQFGLSLYDKETARTAGVESMPRNNGNGHGHNSQASARPNHASHEPATMTIEQANAVLCPVGSNQNPQWASMPLGQVMSQPSGEKMLAYLAGEQFKPDGDAVRNQAKIAAGIILKNKGA
jgi:recombination DNA repair RAD52 pathway protein